MKKYIFRNKIVQLNVLTILGFFLTQCEKETPEMVNEEELITSVTLSISTTNESSQTIRWVQGKQAPEITLKSDTTYAVEISFLDESDPTDVENITEEVIEEADEHLVYYDNNLEGLNIQSAANDVKDSKGVAIGIRTQWQTGAGGALGALRVYLVHEPVSKTANTRAAVGGETDVEVDFSIRIND